MKPKNPIDWAIVYVVWLHKCKDQVKKLPAKQRENAYWHLKARAAFESRQVARFTRV